MQMLLYVLLVSINLFKISEMAKFRKKYNNEIISYHVNPIKLLYLLCQYNITVELTVYLLDSGTSTFPIIFYLLPNSLYILNISFSVI